MAGSRAGAFTLVEVLIVVVILGIMAAMVVPQFASATSDASSMATLDQLTKLRQSLAVYYVRNNGSFPNVVASAAGDWGELMTEGYLREPPVNMWIPDAVSKAIVFGTGPDAAYTGTYGWIFDPSTGDVWAGSFDGGDQPFARP